MTRGQKCAAGCAAGAVLGVATFGLVGAIVGGTIGAVAGYMTGNEPLTPMVGGQVRVHRLNRISRNDWQMPRANGNETRARLIETDSFVLRIYQSLTDISHWHTVRDVRMG